MDNIHLRIVTTFLFLILLEPEQLGDYHLYMDKTKTFIIAIDLSNSV